MAVITVKVWCPKCRANISINVDTKIVENSSYYPVPYAYVHGEPLHILIIYLDRDFKVRGADLSEYVAVQSGQIALQTRREPILNLKSIISYLGVYNFALILGGVLLGKKIYVHGPSDVVEAFKKSLIECRVVPSEDRFSLKEDKDTIVIDFFTNEIRNAATLLSEYPLKLANRLYEADESAARLILRNEMERINNAIKMLSKIKEIISHSKAREILNLGKDEQKILPYIIEGGKLRKKVLPDAEYALRSALW